MTGPDPASKYQPRRHLSCSDASLVTLVYRDRTKNSVLSPIGTKLDMPVRPFSTLIVLLAFPFGPRLAADEPPVFTTPPELVLESGAGEGPVWHPQLGLLTSGDGNINRLHIDGKVSVYRHDAGSNGLLFDRSGRLIVCENRKRRITRTNIDGTITVLADSYNGTRFNPTKRLNARLEKPDLFFRSPIRKPSWNGNA